MLDQELLAKAEANDVQAIFEVAKAYYIGDGVEENNEKAFELFSKVVALDPNFPDVYSRIGRCYEKGWGTAQDLKKAVDAIQAPILIVLDVITIWPWPMRTGLVLCRMNRRLSNTIRLLPIWATRIPW